MSNRDAGGGPAAAKLREPRRRATLLVVVGMVLTVVGIAGLVLTEPVTSRDPGELRAWAVWVVVVGLGVTVAGLVSRAAPIAEQRPRPPRQPTWLLMVVAGCGIVTMIAAVSMGRDEPLEYVSPGLLTVYPFVIYGYQRWRDRRWTEAHSQASPTSTVE